MYLCDKISYCRFCRRQIGTNCKILKHVCGTRRKCQNTASSIKHNQIVSYDTHTLTAKSFIVFSRLSLSLSLSLSISHLPFLTIQRWKVKECSRSKSKWAYSLVLRINHFAFESICQNVKSVDEQKCQKHKNTSIVSRSLSV